MKPRRDFVLALFALPLCAAAQPGFDHSHAAWDTLLRKHVKLISDNQGRPIASQVDYKAFAQQRQALASYLQSLSAVTPAQYEGWSKQQKYAFLANAYNAFTIEKILTRYPNLKSIRDFGSVLGNPWKDRFFTLLGKPQHLDGIEHETMRAPGAFDDPRVHVAANCASVGCPMLGNRAFTPDKLDAQLEELFIRFMSDRSRNRYNQQTKAAELSRIFDWYGKDFEKGHKGFSSVNDVVAKYAEQLADSPDDRAQLRSGQVPIRFMEYDWSLNDVR
ncbi:MAG TPA: DUF547 domain-containing protein [Burkholderiaceae bacterium]|nr:DUF547 domain-containing protein [Burkholderiaceae bacterium]